MQVCYRGGDFSDDDLNGSDFMNIGPVKDNMLNVRIVCASYFFNRETEENREAARRKTRKRRTLISVKYRNHKLIPTRSGVLAMSRRTEKWITDLIDGLDEHVDEKTRAKILERCGRQCQSQSFIKKARDIFQESKNINEFLDKLGRVYKHLHKEGDKVYITYPKCYCPQVNRIPKGKLSGTYCNCSRGWAKALFEGALGRPVEVVKEKSIISGDDQCKFRIML